MPDHLAIVVQLQLTASSCVCRRPTRKQFAARRMQRRRRRCHCKRSWPWRMGGMTAPPSSRRPPGMLTRMRTCPAAWPPDSDLIPCLRVPARGRPRSACLPYLGSQASLLACWQGYVHHKTSSLHDKSQGHLRIALLARLPDSIVQELAAGTRQMVSGWDKRLVRTLHPVRSHVPLTACM